MTTDVVLREKESWHLGMIPKQAPAFIAGRVLADLADTDDRIVVLTPDLGFSNRTIEFAKRHPDRFFDSPAEVQRAAAGRFIELTRAYQALIGVDE